MGTNFYERGKHLGKRSAAGLYCWDCGLTLCKGGDGAIHHTTHDWYKTCPQCGAKPQDEGWEGTAGVELGFAKKKPTQKTGVASCGSFTWAMEPTKVKGIAVKDEYGRLYTKRQWQAVLRACPIRYTHSIGIEFS